MSEPEHPSFPVIRGREIRVDESGLVSLTDIWRAAGYSKNQGPSQWQRLPFVTSLIVALLERIMGKSPNSKISTKSIIHAVSGANGGTYADVRLALAYAEYLNPKLALEVREVFLRYKAADPTLADEILERASPDANLWAAQRAIGRVVRVRYTDVLKDHGAKGKDFPLCTDTTYTKLFDMPAKQLRKAKGLANGANVRDAMTASELAFIAASEALSAERIEEEDSQDGTACRIATGRSAQFIRDAIDADRRSRQRPLL